MRVWFYVGYTLLACWAVLMAWGLARLPLDAPLISLVTYILAYAYGIYGALLLRAKHKAINERDRWVERNTNPETRRTSRDWWGWLKQ